MRAPSRHHGLLDRSPAAPTDLAAPSEDPQLAPEVAGAPMEIPEVEEGGAAVADRQAQHALGGIEDGAPRRAVPVGGTREGVDPGAEQRLVRVDVAQARGHALVQQHGLPRGAPTGDPRGPFGEAHLEHVGPDVVDGAGPLWVVDQGPAAEAAHVAVAYRAALEVEDGVHVPVGGMVGRKEELPGHSQVEHEVGGRGAVGVEAQDHVLAVAMDEVEALALHRPAHGPRIRLEDRGAPHAQLAEPTPDHLGPQGRRDALHLRQLGH